MGQAPTPDVDDIIDLKSKQFDMQDLDDMVNIDPNKNEVEQIED